jgi:hypothetical protein
MTTTPVILRTPWFKATYCLKEANVELFPNQHGNDMMNSASRSVFLGLLSLPLIFTGCAKPPLAAPPAAGAPPLAQGPAAGSPATSGSGQPGAASPIKNMMGRLTKGPQSLTPVIGRELAGDPPAWETIQAQTKEFAALAATMGKHEPPKGSKESWTKLTASYAAAAAALDQAAQAKDKAAAQAAHQTLSGSCKACHQEHRPSGPPGGAARGGAAGG